jgi:hypothetical protein
MNPVVQNGSEGPRLNALEDLDVGIGGFPPYLNAIGPDGFEYCFVEEFAFYL